MWRHATDQGKYAQAEALFDQAWEPRRGCWVPSILTPFRSFPNLHSCTNEKANTPWRRLRRAGPGGAARTPWARKTRHDGLGSRPGAGLLVAGEVRRERAAGARGSGDRSKRVQPDDWQRFRAESLLGASLAGEKKYAEAEPLLLEGYQGMLPHKDHISRPRPVPPGSCAAMAGSALSGLGQAGEGCGVAEEVKSVKADVMRL